jgi:hypothetical protein
MVHLGIPNAGHLWLGSRDDMGPVAGEAGPPTDDDGQPLTHTEEEPDHLTALGHDGRLWVALLGRPFDNLRVFLM